jgi:Spy/CpxP family protein refolding chaperone
MLKFGKLFIFITLALSLVMLAITATSADPNSPNDRGNRIAKVLNLTDAQKSQLKPLLQNAFAQFKAIRADTTLTPDQRRQKIQELRTETKTAVDQILTPAQQQKLADLKAEFHKHHDHQNQQPQTPAPPQSQ